MKVTIELDCTPEEFRRFMGLPDVSSLHEEFTDKMKEAMSAANPAFDAEGLMKAWFPLGGDAMSDLQKAMWQGMMGGTKDKP